MRSSGGAEPRKRKNLSELMYFAGKYRFLTYASWLFSAASALMALVPFVYIWLIIRNVVQAEGDYSHAAQLAHYGWMALLFAVLSMLVYFGALMCSHLSAFRVASNLRRAALDRVVRLPSGFTAHMGSGKIRRIINESSGATETYLAHQLPDMVGAFITPAGLIALLFVFDWMLGLLSLLPTLLAFIVMARMTGKRMAESMRQYQDALDAMNNEAVEYVRGIPVVKTFGQTVYSFKRFKGTIDGYGHWVIDYTRQLRLPMVIFTTLINGVFAVLIAAALAVTGRGVTDPAFLLNLLFYIIFTPILAVTLNRIMFMSENNMIVNDALNRIHLILDAQPLPEPVSPVHPADGSVQFENVSFRYPGAERDALCGISLHAQAGQTVALVGPSGGGKTTAASLVARFWDVTQGSVRVGGADVRDIPKRELADTVACVFQDSVLLKTSVFENVRLGKPEATRAEVAAALHAAQCDDILAKLPQGMDTVIGGKGVYLSGGEQQRIAIARVMLKDAPVIVLDEATAFADPENEALVQRAFERLAAGRTVLMIAHRLTTFRNADRICVLKDGRICEEGTHGALVARGGVYAAMWQEYQRSVSWKVGGEE